MIQIFIFKIFITIFMYDNKVFMIPNIKSTMIHFIKSLLFINNKNCMYTKKRLWLKKSQVVNPRSQDHNSNTNSFKFKSSNSSKSQYYFQDIQNGIHRFIIKQINFQSSHKVFKEFLKHRRMINLSMQYFNQIQVMNTNTFILWVSIHEYQKILFVIPILRDQDDDLDKTYSNQIVNLKLIIKSSKSISRFTKYHETINLDQMGKAFFK